jgi:ABC-type Fe3+-hydroxamate transport system substrate-binding protein
MSIDIFKIIRSARTVGNALNVYDAGEDLVEFFKSMFTSYESRSPDFNDIFPNALG